MPPPQSLQKSVWMLRKYQTGKSKFISPDKKYIAFQDRLWEAVDEEWMDCLRKEAVENLLQIPCGVVQVLFFLFSVWIELNRWPLFVA